MEFITDRTEADVARWQELRRKGYWDMTPAEQVEWSTGMKGCYGATDMNRVENAVAVLSERFTKLGYNTPTLTIKTNWGYSDLPSATDITRYFGNVEALRSVRPLYPTTPTTPTVEQRMTYEMANDLEKILFDIDDMTTKIASQQRYAGEIFAGEV